MPTLGPLELMIVMGLAVLLFGKRLPEVGRQLGRGIIEFKKGMSGIADELGDSSSSNISHYSSNYGTSRRYDEKPRSDTGLHGRLGPQVRASRHGLVARAPDGISAADGSGSGLRTLDRLGASRRPAPFSAWASARRARRMFWRARAAASRR